MYGTLNASLKSLYFKGKACYIYKILFALYVDVGIYIHILNLRTRKSCLVYLYLIREISNYTQARLRSYMKEHKFH